MKAPYEAKFKPAAKPILLAPFIFVCHVIEEAPGFMAWFNAHVRSSINHWQLKKWSLGVVNGEDDDCTF